ncbi:MAG: PIN domain-containing protein [Micrococcales bacterium]|nr:PIN domain-containing protein [Micrococcales bacterium]
MRVLLDTSVLIPISEAGQEPPDLSDVDDALVSTLSFAELAIGVHSATNVAVLRHRTARLAALREVFGAGLPFDDDCEKSYQRILAHIADAGGDVKARRFDRLIAATALTHDATLVTRNAEHVASLRPLVSIDVR